MASPDRVAREEERIRAIGNGWENWPEVLPIKLRKTASSTKMTFGENPLKRVRSLAELSSAEEASRYLGSITDKRITTANLEMAVAHFQTQQKSTSLGALGPPQSRRQVEERMAIRPGIPTEDCL